MAERRMFTKKITESDMFLDMPSSSQALYFHLSMNADDDGFINNPKSIQRTVGASDDDMKLLLAKKFIIVFDTGVIVIKHWKMHNYIQADRYKPTTFLSEKKSLSLNENKEYVSNLDTECIQNGYTGKDRLGKDRLGNNIYIESTEDKKHKYGEYKNVLLTDKEYEKLKSEFTDLEKRIEDLSGYIASTGKTYKSHYATIRNWAKRESKKTEEPKRKSNGLERDIVFDDDYENSITSN